MTDYKKMIIELISRIDDNKVLKTIFDFVNHTYLKFKGGE